MCELITCAKCCTFYSLSGFLFLISIGILLEKQPLYIHGVEDAQKGAQGCYAGAGLYIASMFLSVAYWVYYVRIQEPRNAATSVSLGKEGLPLANGRTQAKYAADSAEAYYKWSGTGCVYEFMIAERRKKYFDLEKYCNIFRVHPF